jgi:hypothetical protein
MSRLGFLPLQATNTSSIRQFSSSTQDSNNAQASSPFRWFLFLFTIGTTISISPYIASNMINHNFKLMRAKDHPFMVETGLGRLGLLTRFFKTARQKAVVDADAVDLLIEIASCPEYGDKIRMSAIEILGTLALDDNDSQGGEDVNAQVAREQIKANERGMKMLREWSDRVDFGVAKDLLYRIDKR